MSLAQQKTTQKETETKREGGGEPGSPLDGQLSWQLPVGRAAHTKSVCQGEKPPPPLLLSFCLPLHLALTLDYLPQKP